MKLNRASVIPGGTNVVQLVADGYRYGGHPYRDCGFNGISLHDCKEGERYNLQISGLFMAWSDETFNVGDFIVLSGGSIFTVATSVLKSSIPFGKVTVPTDPLTQMFAFILLQDYR